MHFLAAALASAALLSSPPSRVVVLAFDGVDAGLVTTMMAAGRLPNLSALAARGGFSPLTPPVPPQTPVSWSSFSTGLDPGGHQIFDFLKRDPADMTPTFAVAQETEVPFLLGNKTPAAIAAFGVLFVVPAAFLLARRKRLAGAVLLLLGVAVGVGGFLAARAWLPASSATGGGRPSGRRPWPVRPRSSGSP